MLLYRFSRRVSALVRLVILGLVSWSVAVAGHGIGFSGRSLVITIFLAIGIVAWLVWTLHPASGPVFRGAQRPGEPVAGEQAPGNLVLGRLVQARDRSYVMAVYTLAGAGGFLLAANSASAASGFVFAGVIAAGSTLETLKAAPVPALGCLSLGVGVLIYDHGALVLLAYGLGFAVALLASSNARQTVLRAEQAELLLAQAQRSREEQLRSARLEESTRIAREIHDVLAHSLAGLAIQLEATRALLEQGAQRELVAGRLDQALKLARGGLEETRRAVGVLRGEAVAVPTSLEAMLADYRSASGRPASFVLEGDRTRLVGPVGLAVLRVAQEALTNVRKHAPGAEVSVLLRAGSEPHEDVVLIVSDERVKDSGAGERGARDTAGRYTAGRDTAGPEADGREAAWRDTDGREADRREAERSALAATGGGYGLRGMGERAEILGGSLSAGPTDEGWRVELRLPDGAGA